MIMANSVFGVFFFLQKLGLIGSCLGVGGLKLRKAQRLNEICDTLISCYCLLKYCLSLLVVFLSGLYWDNAAVS